MQRHILKALDGALKLSGGFIFPLGAMTIASLLVVLGMRVLGDERSQVSWFIPLAGFIACAMYLIPGYFHQPLNHCSKRGP